MKDKEKHIEIKDKQWQRRENYCLRIQKALQYKGTNDNEDVPSILVDFEKEIKNEILPENARVFIPDGQMVLLSREEYAKLKQYEEKVKSGVCFTQKEWLDLCDGIIVKIMIFVNLK